MTDQEKVVFIVPCFNEASVIYDNINKIFKTYNFVVCVDDGSNDESVNEIRKTNALLVKHPINLGQGAALQTGVEYVLKFLPGIEYFVTFDADGQHSLKDVTKMLKTIKKERLDIVMGSRFLGRAHGIKYSKKLVLKAAIKFTNIFSSVKLTDTHNGLRVFNRKFAESLNITMSDMAHASEIIDIIGSGEWTYKEVPITISYTDYSMSKGQSMFNSINILFDLLITRIGRKR